MCVNIKVNIKTAVTHPVLEWQTEILYTLISLSEHVYITLIDIKNQEPAKIYSVFVAIVYICI